MKKKKTPVQKPIWLVSTFKGVYEVPATVPSEAVRVVQRDFHISHHDIYKVSSKSTK